MAKYSNLDIEAVKQADIRRFIPGTDLRPNQTITCPFCGKKKFSVVHKANKNFAYCFSCQKSFSSPIDAVMYYSRLTWLQAVERVALEAGIPITPQP